MHVAFVTILVAIVSRASSSSSSSSSQILSASYNLQRQRQQKVQQSSVHSTRSLTPARDCTLQIIAYVKLPSLDNTYGVDIEDDDDEVFECEIDPADVPGNYAGLSRQLDLSKKQKRQFKQLWQDGIVTPGITKLRLADIHTAAAAVAAADSGVEGDSVTVTSLQSYTTSTSNKNDAMGSHITVPADFDIETLLVADNNNNNNNNNNSNNQSRKLQSATALTPFYGVNTGTRPILVVKIIDINGLQCSETPAEISQDIFGSTDDTVNLHSQILDCSMKRLNLTHVVPLGSIGGIAPNLYDAPGVITINVKRDLTITPSATMINDAIIAIQDKFNLTRFPGPYGHVLFIIQKDYINPGWAAWASLGSPTQHQWKSCYQGVYYKFVGVQVHEIGHNFGLRHSGGFDGCDYTDWTCLMGNPLVRRLESVCLFRT